MDQKPAMSLVAQFDDLSRLVDSNIRGNDIALEFLEFVKNQELCRQRWQAAESRARTLEEENKNLALAKAHLEAKLLHVMGTLENEVARRERCEQKLALQRQRFNQIRQCILSTHDHQVNQENMVRLNHLVNLEEDAPAWCLNLTDRSVGSVLSPSGSESDDTAATPQPPLAVDPQQADIGGRSSLLNAAGDNAPGGTFEAEKSIGDSLAIGKACMAQPSEVFSTTMSLVAGNRGYVATMTSRLEEDPSMLPRNRARRSLSNPAEPTAASQPRTPRRSVDDSVLEPQAGFVAALDELGPLRRSTPLGLDRHRAHVFAGKTMLRPDKCSVCGKRIPFYKTASKCTLCAAVCHPLCEPFVEQPCMPCGKVSHLGLISDHVPSTAPMVPPLLVHCLLEVERRAAAFPGALYATPAPKEQVRELVQCLLRGKDTPDLASYELPVVCGAVLDFISSLKETLVTKSLWRNFVKASEAKDSGERLWQLVHHVGQLPRPNRDSLSLLLRHLHRLRERPGATEDLVAAFSPFMVGCSVDSPSPQLELEEASKHARVCCLLPG
ncbi:unnamed protein product [Ixodes hexagonus]